jgi:hypothetical protein
MSLEGRIRELGLHEVCQLLALSRKTGVLEVRAPLLAQQGMIGLQQGMVVHAVVCAIDAPYAADPDAVYTAAEIEAAVLELLTWADGSFRFLTREPAALSARGVRVAMEPLLVEAAQRAEGWAQLQGRVPNARVVPAFVDVDPQQLPLLRLVPQEWEVLTRVDGTRDLTELAALLGRDVLDVAGIVDGLMASGLLTLRERAARDFRRHATPPSVAVPVALPDVGPAVVAMVAPAVGRLADLEDDGRDLWIPDDDRDAIFDPMHAGVQGTDGLPRDVHAGVSAPALAQSVTSGDLSHASLRPGALSGDVRMSHTVASPHDEPSLQQEEYGSTEHLGDAARLCRLGDEAARGGDLARALTLWSAALRSPVPTSRDAPVVDADRVREAIALAARLHALLHPA